MSPWQKIVSHCDFAVQHLDLHLGFISGLFLRLTVCQKLEGGNYFRLNSKVHVTGVAWPELKSPHIWNRTAVVCRPEHAAVAFVWGCSHLRSVARANHWRLKFPYSESVSTYETQGRRGHPGYRAVQLRLTRRSEERLTVRLEMQTTKSVFSNPIAAIS